MSEPPNPWRRWTAVARAASEVAKDEARASGTNWVSPEVLLLGLLSQEDSVFMRVLKEFHVDPNTVRLSVFGVLSRTYELPTDQPELDKRAEVALQKALRAAYELNNDYMGTEHMLLGILRCEKASGPLRKNGLDADAVLEAVIRIQAEDRASRK